VQVTGAYQRASARGGHILGHGIEVGFEQICVHVERHRRAGVPEHALHDLRVGPGVDRQ
jgi:hypothetical protein